MANEPTEVPALDGLERLQYWLVTTRDNFDVSRFRGALPPAFQDSDATSLLLEATDEPFPYYVVLSWSIFEDDVEVSIDYHLSTGAMRSAEAEDNEGFHEPLTDDDADDVETLPCPEHLMSWLGQFFGSNSASSHAHARYRFVGDKKQLTFGMALTSAPPAEAELYGVALRLRNAPDGVTSVRLTRGLSDWYVEITYDRELKFTSFDPVTDAATLLATLNLFLMEKRP